MTKPKSYYRYWGKTPRGDNLPRCHLLTHHSLDVAAVGWVLLDADPGFHRYFAARLGLSREEFQRISAFFLSIHDVGKFSLGFQCLDPELFQYLQGEKREHPYSVRHDSAGFALWRWELRPMFAGDDQSKVLDRWAAAVTGHHGEPPHLHKGVLPIDPSRHYRPVDIAAARDFVTDVQTLLLGSSLADYLKQINLAKESIDEASWWIAGHAVLSDWIGSNREFFPFRAEPIELDTYWKEALDLARRAVDEIGILPGGTIDAVDLRSIAPKIDTPTPLQRLANELDPADKPHLFVIEDVTGAGKTEAALLIANRLIAKDLADGVYMALPTMATANAMYSRIGPVYKLLCRGGDQPSLVLAHSARKQNAGFRDSLIPLGSKQERDYDHSEEASASATCNAWFADSNKRSLLAHVGVGTIDQALLSILQSKHQSLRLLGLFRKVLIVDEVHACDAYLHRLLRAVLRFHAWAGGSAILMSATLPMRMRNDLVGAFEQGAARDHRTVQSQLYPLVTQVTDAVREIHIDTRESVKRRVDVEFIDTEDRVIEIIIARMREGQCVCWVRNTVYDAVSAYEALRRRMAEGHLSLFHARFTMGDRLDIENHILQSFGPESEPDQRQGRVVVSTQVVEQSLDLDFDHMVTDLPPIDLVIQRAGRLRRHSRDARGCRIVGPDTRPGTATISVLAPGVDSRPDRDWYSRQFPRGAFVYPDHGRMWLTAELLRKRGGFSMPEDARGLIETVYGEGVEDNIPEELQERTWEQYAKERADASLAMMNSLTLEAGYGRDHGVWWDDTHSPTRLGEPSHPVYVARWDDERLVPWHGDGSGRGWEMSRLTVRTSIITEAVVRSDDKLFGAIESVSVTLPGGGKWATILPFVRSGGNVWEASVFDGKGRKQRVRYDPVRGLLTGALLENSDT